MKQTSHQTNMTPSAVAIKPPRHKPEKQHGGSLMFSFSNFLARVPLFVLVGLQLHILGRNTGTYCTCSQHMG
ncbi:hypothetical protein MTR_4g106420 [Medicago truncatula]|uniref:Uncharacterized protein n=1 Tax=Medicago truncatula TaxID=3880 RepID=G7JNR4_MEDTR|nr:hypothetical protein MTR_4g106420 [Medicago truncatula]